MPRLVRLFSVGGRRSADPLHRTFVAVDRRGAGAPSPLPATRRPGAAGCTSAAAAVAASVAMIGMPGVDLLGAVELFEEHAAHEKMRPGHRAERHYRIGALDNGGP